MKLFAALTTLLALAIASPVEVAIKKDDALEKRDTEIVYLVNCRHLTSCCGPETHSSHIAYYAASGQSHNGETPANDNVCTVDSSNYAWWEQDGKKCTFPTGVTFTSHIDSDAQSRPLYSWSGWGSNGFKNWDCYRDDGHKLYEYSGPEWATVCSSVYYCKPQ
ncbi:hypothetical protein B0J18DRAFT_439436 [Chaetomium sp. MPI-SDFR-AT-0129]|uniref:Uncharacterized protein n=1 Tax=Dichotomopilus funicola TaxID=1934379 RepID=A0AAN6ZJI1_9PEZI|nr:hypothetical protein B0J18DRAFT_439436 [Chaetomium sp. MPI-SDFR-AT-0129]KAK4140767.1 hypothetical protein C8A04DRAFT_39673 [Dichotomopilus funicola]